MQTATDPTPGYYPQDDGTVILVRTSKRSWYAIRLSRRPDYSLAREYLGHHTTGLHNPVSLEEATNHLIGAR